MFSPKPHERKKKNQPHTLIQSFVIKLYTITDPTFFALITKIPCLHLRETTFKLTEQKKPRTNKNKNKTNKQKEVRTTFCHKMVQNLIKNKNEGKGY